MKTPKKRMLLFAVSILLAFMSINAFSQIECTPGVWASDQFQDAPAMKYDSGYCVSSSTQYTADMPGNICQSCNMFEGSIENNAWYKFVANSSSAVFFIESTNCNNNEFPQFAFYRYGSNAFTLLSDIAYTNANVSGTHSDTLHNLIPGETIYVMIDGYAGSICDTRIQILNSESDPNTCNMQMGPDQTICYGNSASIYATGVPAGMDIIWTSIPYDPNLNDHSAQIVVNPTVNTKYFAEIHHNGLVCKDSMMVIVDTSFYVYAGSDVSICQGSAALLNPIGADIYNWDPNTGVTALSDSTFSVSPSHTTTYTVLGVNQNGCSMSDEVVVTVIPAPQFQIISQSDSISMDTTAYHFSTGLNCPDCIYEWSINGTVLSNNPEFTHLAGNDTSFVINAKVTNQLGCSATAYLYIQPDTDQTDSVILIRGKVFGMNQIIDKAVVYIYQKEGNSHSVVSSQTIDSTQNFGFFVSPGKEYYIKAELDNSSVYLGEFAPTYYGDVLSWNDAAPIPVQGYITDVEIHLLPMFFASGDGSISGILAEGSFYKNNEISNVNIFLYDNTQNVLVSCTKTNSNGEFSFKNINFSNYNVFAEYFGKVSLPVQVIINSNNPDNSQVSLLITESTVGGVNNEIHETEAKVYPNPVKDILIIENSSDRVMGRVSIYNMEGKVIYEQALNQTIQQIDMSDFSKGIYMVRIMNNESQQTLRLIKE